MEKPSICLVMMVKDEANVIERALESCRNVVQDFVITDTGSRDGTQDVIRSWAARHGVPGTVVDGEWLGWGGSRTRAWGNAQSQSKSVYGLILDADDVVEASGPINFRDPADGYYVRITKDVCSWRRPDILRIQHPWKWEGADHPKLLSPSQVGFGKCPEFRIRVYPDGSRTTTQPNPWSKFIHGADLLRHDLEDNPGDERATYYLAQNLRDAALAALSLVEGTRQENGVEAGTQAAINLGRQWFTESLAWYKKRILLGGFEEERWQAMWAIGCILDELGRDIEVPSTLLAAYQMRPWRSEPLVCLAEHYRNRGWNDAALLVAKQAVTLPYPEDDLLPVRDDFYEWGAQFAYAHALASTGQKDLASAIRKCGHGWPAEAQQELDELLAGGSHGT